MTYKERIQQSLEDLRSVRFPCKDWKEDAVFFDRMEQAFSAEAEDAETDALLQQLRALIRDKRDDSRNRNKTTEELYAGWNDD